MKSKNYKIPPENKRNPDIPVKDYLWLAILDDQAEGAPPVNFIPQDDWLTVYYIFDSHGKKRWKVIS